MQNIEVRIFATWYHGADFENEPDRFMGYYSRLNRNFFDVPVTVHNPPYCGLEPIENSVKPISDLSAAITVVWNMGKDDGRTIFSFKRQKLSFQPS